MGNNATTTLRQEVINDIESRTSLTAEQIRRLFQNFSLVRNRRTRSQSIKIDDLTSLFDETFDGESQNFAKRLFDVMDVDKNGKVDFQEFVTSFLQLNGTEGQKLAWLFSLYDVDHRGYIYYDDLCKAVQAILDLLSYNMFGESNTAQTIANEILDSVDKNKDNRISTSEFIEGATSCATLWRLLEVSTDAAQKPFKQETDFVARAPGRRRSTTVAQGKARRKSSTTRPTRPRTTTM